MSLINRINIWVAQPLEQPLVDEASLTSAVPRSLGSFAYMIRLLSQRPGMKLLLLGLGAVYGLLGLGLPLCHKYAIDLLTGAGVPQSEVISWFIVGCLFLLLNRLMAVGITGLCLREAFITERWLSQQIYMKTLRLSETERQGGVGETVALMSSHLTMISFFLVDLLPAFFLSFIPLLMAPLVLAEMVEVPMTPVMVLVILSQLLSFLMAMRSSTLYQRFKVQFEKRNGLLNEWLQNLVPLRSLGWTEVMESQVVELTDECTGLRQKVASWASWMNAVAASLPSLFTVFALYILVSQADPGKLSPGNVLGVLWVLGVFLFVPMRAMPWVYVLYFDAATSLARIVLFLQRPGFLERSLPFEGRTGEAPFTNASGPGVAVEKLELFLQDVPVLRDISLKFPAGGLTVVVGEIGAGKSLLLKSLIGEMPARFSAYRFGGADMLSYPCSQWSGGYVYCPQDAFVFAATIQENVRMAYQRDSRPPPEEVLGAMQLAQMERDLASFPQGVASFLGERGINLSGGQKQRTELARAVFHDRAVVLLDDPLSALDAETEEAVVEQLICGSWQHKTRIVTTHRLSLLQHAHQVVFMQGGRVVAAGTLQQLQQREDFREFLSAEAQQSGH